MFAPLRVSPLISTVVRRQVGNRHAPAATAIKSLLHSAAPTTRYHSTCTHLPHTSTTVSNTHTPTSNLHTLAQHALRNRNMLLSNSQQPQPNGTMPSASFASQESPRAVEIDAVDIDKIYQQFTTPPAEQSPTSPKKTAIDDMVDANVMYHDAYSQAGLPPLPLRPGKKLAVVTCMDSRIDVFKCFGLRHGDAHVIRNAGGRIQEALRSVMISQNLLGTEEVAIIHHTNCGMESMGDEAMKQKIIDERVAADPKSKDEVTKQIQPITMLSFNGTGPEDSVLEDLRYFRASPLVKHTMPVRGFVYNVHEGKLTEIFDRTEG